VNEAASFIFHFIMNYLDDDVEELEELQFLYDSIVRQNKNYTIFCFIRYIINNQNHNLKNIKITFPV
jgi:excinuclease UvrABC helicase subunit UvrB